MSSLLSSSRNSRSTSNNKKSHRKRSSDTPYNNDVDADMKIAALTTAPTTPITTTTTTTSTTKLRVRIKKYHGVAKWSWNVNGSANVANGDTTNASSNTNGTTDNVEEDDVCGICQSDFEGCPPGVKFPGDESPVVFGVCGHAFHLQCVATWLNSSRQTCPICRADWEYGNSGNQRGGAGAGAGAGASANGGTGGTGAASVVVVAAAANNNNNANNGGGGGGNAREEV